MCPSANLFYYEKKNVCNLISHSDLSYGLDYALWSRREKNHCNSIFERFFVDQPFFLNREKIISKLREIYINI